jgi:hypothetical protein
MSGVRWRFARKSIEGVEDAVAPRVYTDYLTAEAAAAA